MLFFYSMRHFYNKKFHKGVLGKKKLISKLLYYINKNKNGYIMEDTSIVILGGGLSGSIMASLLSSMSIKSIIIEKFNYSPESFLSDTRTNSISKAAYEIITKSPYIKDAILDYTNPIEHIYVATDNSSNVLEFYNHGSPMGYMIKNSDFRKILHDAIVTDPNVKIHTNTEYKEISFENNKALIKCKNNSSEFEILADLVFVCDSRFSIAREKFFQSVINKDYKQKSVVYNISHELPHDNVALEHFYPNGPFASLPLKGGFDSAIVFSMKEEVADAFLTMSDKNIEFETESAMNFFLGKIKLKSKPTGYKLTASLAKQYVYKNLILIADAAHNVHPLAGQGLNNGILDIQEAIDSLLSIIDLGFELSDSYSWHKYSQKRSSDNRNMFIATDNINNIFSNNNPLLKITRSLMLKAAEELPYIKKYMMNKAMSKR
jgi:2-octaprenyl-6-methoxyphenol hydroxylase